MMEIIAEILGSRMTEALGWLLIHSIWQGAVIAILMGLSLRFLKSRTAELRYIVSYVALITLLICSGITFRKAYQRAENYPASAIRTTQNQVTLDEDTLEVLQSDKHTGLNLTDIFMRSGVQKHFRWLVSLWLLGLTLFYTRTTGGYLHQIYLRRAGRKFLDPFWQKKVRKLAELLRIHKPVEIYSSTRITSPITSGFIKPVILLPVSFLADIPMEQLEAIILHELAHIKRNDYLLNILQTLIETLFFYHPGVWYISSQIRKERENVCDDMAVLHSGDKLNYIKALAEAQKYALNAGELAMAFSSGKYSLLERIKRLNTRLTMKTKLTEKLIAGVLVLSAFFFLSFLVDGSNHSLKSDIEEDPISTDTIPGKKVIIVKAVIDSTGQETVTKQVFEAGDERIDSVLAAEHHGNEDPAYGEKTIKVIINSEDEMLSAKELEHTLQLQLEELQDGDIIIEKMISLEDDILKMEDMGENEHVMIRKRIEKGKDSEDRIIIEIATDEEGNQEHYEIVIPEIDEEVMLELEKAHEEIARAHKELEKAREEEMKGNMEKAIARQEIERAHMEIERAKQEAARKNYEYQYKYVIKGEDGETKEYIMHSPEQSLEEREAALKAEMEALEKELKEVKKQQKGEKKSK